MQGNGRIKKLVDSHEVCGEYEESKKIRVNVKKYNTEGNFQFTLPKTIFKRALFFNDEWILRINDPQFKLYIVSKEKFPMNTFSFNVKIKYSDKMKYYLCVEKLKPIRVTRNIGNVYVEVYINPDFYRATDWTNPTMKKQERDKRRVTPYIGEIYTPKRAYGGLRN